MSTDFDQILDQAISLLTAGESFDSVYAKFPEHKTELAELLPLIHSINTIPIAEATAPTKHYKYANKHSVWQTLAQFAFTYRLALAPAVLILALLGGTTLVRAAQNSLPGQKLYSLKTAGEQTRLTLTFDQDKIASIQVELAQKRLEEVKRAIENNDPEQKLAAISELTKQTEKTLDAVSQVAVNQITEQGNQNLLDNLVAINKEQKSLIETATHSYDTKEQAEVALSESKETDVNLAKLIATVNEQTLLDLPNKISVTGIVLDVNVSRVVIEKNIFYLNKDTIIVGAAGAITNELNNLRGKVTVIGTRDNNDLLAKKIVIIDPDAVLETFPTNPEVKGIITTPIIKPPTPPATPPEVEEQPTPEPKEVQAGFIPEPSSNQFFQ